MLEVQCLGRFGFRWKQKSASAGRWDPAYKVQVGESLLHLGTYWHLE